MRTSIARFVKDESGATAIEYALIAAGLAVAIIAGMATLSGAFTNMMTNLGGKMVIS